MPTDPAATTPDPATAATAPVAIAPPDSPRIERKALDFAVKAMSGDDAAGPGTATLYVAVFGNRDRAGEVIAPNAFRNLDTFVKDGFYTVSHNWGILPVATVTSATQDGTGLLLEIEFHSTPEAQACRTVMRERMERGKGVKSSIGYQVIDDAHETAGGETTRQLKIVDIYEASFVPVPCNERADAVAVKGMGVAGADAGDTGGVSDADARDADAPSLSTKAGRPISRANHDAMSGHVTAGMHGCRLAIKAMGAMDAFLKSFAPNGADDTDADDVDAEDADGETGTKSHTDSDGTPAATEPATKAAPPASTPNHGHDRTPAAAAGSFVARSERLVADFEGLLKALKQQHATRSGEGRTLPAAKWAALKSQIDAAQALYAARPDAASKADTGDSPAAPGLDDVLSQYHATKSLVRATLFTSPK